MSSPSAGTALTRTRLYRLGRFVGSHARLLVLGWLVVTMAAFGLATGKFGNTPLFDQLEQGEPTVAGEALTGRDLLTGADTGATALVTVSGVDVHDPDTAAAVDRFATAVQAKAPVAAVVAPFAVPGGVRSPAAAPMLAGGTPEGDGFLVTVTLERGLSETARDAGIAAIGAAARTELGAIEGARVQTGSVPELVDAVIGQLRTDMERGEGLALPLSLIVMIVVFGGFVAAGMPVLGAIASIGGALATLVGFSHVMELDATVVNIVTVLGLGLCIDYGLLVVSRFREEVRHLAQSRTSRRLSDELVLEATARTVAAAGRTVLFSAVTVGISLAGLLVFEATLMRAIGSAAVSVVVVALLVALTLVPALCRLGARRLMRGGLELAPAEGAFSRLARAVQRWPWLVVGGTVAILVMLALPALNLRLVSSGTELLPTSAPQRSFFDELARDYPTTRAPQVTVVGRTDLTTAATWAKTAATYPGVVSVDPPTEVSPGVVQIGLRTDGTARDDVDTELVDHVHAHRPPFESWVTGQRAILTEFVDSLVARAPAAFLLVAGATIALLFLMSGSLVLPLKALVFNVLSLGASLGILAWVFQDGHASGVLHFTSAGGVESTIPFLVLAFGFGLSMDYEVFLLSRIIELHEQGASDLDAVVYGLQRSGRIITSAALLIVIVFAGFAAGDMLIIKETGVALAVAVVLDATLVRMLLVPATMSLFGRWNWWAPRPLRRLHDRFALAE